MQPSKGQNNPYTIVAFPLLKTITSLLLIPVKLYLKLPLYIYLGPINLLRSNRLLDIKYYKEGSYKLIPILNSSMSIRN